MTDGSAAPLALVVDDEPTLRAVVRDALDREGFLVEAARDGWQARRLLENASYDLVILDLVLPGPGGRELLRELRARGSTAAVLVLTGERGRDTLVELLDAGADDFLEKPFELEELRARCRALVRRVGRPGGSGPLGFGDITLDPERRTARVGGAPLELPRREFDLLETLLRLPGRAVDRDTIRRRVWGIDFDPGTNRVEVTVSRLRRDLGDAGSKLRIQAVPGVGYRLESGRDAQSV
jgi:DNA-binding response OmpR family regulator